MSESQSIISPLSKFFLLITIPADGVFSYSIGAMFLYSKKSKIDSNSNWYMYLNSLITEFPMVSSKFIMYMYINFMHSSISYYEHNIWCYSIHKIIILRVQLDIYTTQITPLIIIFTKWKLKQDLKTKGDHNIIKIKK